MELFVLSFELDDDDWFSFGSFFDLERPMFHIRLDDGVVEFPADESFGVKDGVVWVLGGLVFGGVADESFGLCEGDIGWGGSVSLIVGNDFDSVVLPDSDTGVSSTEIDSNSFRSVGHWFRSDNDYRRKGVIFIG